MLRCSQPSRRRSHAGSERGNHGVRRPGDIYVRRELRLLCREVHVANSRKMRDRVYATERVRKAVDIGEVAHDVSVADSSLCVDHGDIVSGSYEHVGHMRAEKTGPPGHGYAHRHAARPRPVAEARCHTNVLPTARKTHSVR